MELQIDLNKGNHKTKIISAFPGVGKSHFFRSAGDRVVADSDSSTFPKEHFPQNYIDHIKTLVGNVDYALVSSHDNVRQALVDNGFEFNLVYPSRDQKDVYMERYRERGSPEGFLRLMSEKWDDFLSSCESQSGCKHTVLQPGQYLSDIIN